MIQIFADGELVYDSRLEDYDLRGLKVTTGLNKGGTAEIVMPAGHPAYDSYTSFKTIVEIYRDGLLQFRGRALYPDDDYYKNRTVVCEGELCFFQDAVCRPYLYQSTPEQIFTDLLRIYNEQVEEVKHFSLGEVDVTDPNDYVRFESEDAESVLTVINKLLERCGGYLIFTTSPEDGSRLVSWYKELGFSSDQVIEFGENLLSFSRSGVSTGLATAVIPYGAKIGSTGQRITIESVNDGADFIEDADAVALRGRITVPVVWDDVTEPANLLKKAREYLEEHRYLVTSLELTALDLSYMDKSIDSYRVGDTIRVLSKPHQVDELFRLTERAEDMLNPASSTITLGASRKSLTGTTVAGDTKAQSGLSRVSTEIRAGYSADISAAIQATEQRLSVALEDTATSIRSEVSEQYVTNDKLTEAVSTEVTQTKNDILVEFTNLKSTVDELDAEARPKLEEIYNYIRFENGNIILGGNESTVTLTLEKDLIVFKKNGVQFGWWDGTNFHTGNIVVEVNERAQFGNFAFVPRSNGSLSFLKVGG